MSESLHDVVSYLNDYLRVAEVPDYANALNGLQVENSGTVRQIITAVDASQETIDGVIALGGHSLVIVHHGLFWDGLRPVTGRRYQRVRALLAHDVALYSAHLPLDVHPVVGNNAQLAQRLDLASEGWFGDYQGTLLGIYGALDRDREALVAELNEELNTSAYLIPGGSERTVRVGIISGGAGDMIGQAHLAGCDTFITGEGAHHTYFDAQELGVNVIYAGHYATEQVGVQALGAHLSTRFDIPWEFHAHPTGL